WKGPAAGKQVECTEQGEIPERQAEAASALRAITELRCRNPTFPATHHEIAYRRFTSTERTTPEPKSTEQENSKRALRHPRCASAIPLIQSLRPGLSSGSVRTNVT